MFARSFTPYPVPKFSVPVQSSPISFGTSFLGAPTAIIAKARNRSPNRASNNISDPDSATSITVASSSRGLDNKGRQRLSSFSRINLPFQNESVPLIKVDKCIKVRPKLPKSRAMECFLGTSLSLTKIIFDSCRKIL